MIKVLRTTVAVASLAVLFISCGEDREYEAEMGWDKVFTMQAEIGSGGIMDLWFNGPNDGWACVDDKILHYDGASWTVAHRVRDSFPREAPFFRAISAARPDNIWVAGRSGWEDKLYHYDGNAWEDVPVVGTYLDTCEIYFPSDSRGWMATDEGIYYYENGNWTLQVAGNVRDICFASEDDGWAAVSTYLYRWDGVGWTPVTLCEMDEGGIYDVSAASADLWWAVGRGITGEGYERKTFPLFYRYDGVSWKELNWPGNLYKINKCGVAADGTGWVLEYGTSWPTQLWAHDGTAATDNLYLEDGVINEIWVFADGETWVCTTSVDTTITKIWHRPAGQ